jgi:hypothetical protein
LCSEIGINKNAQEYVVELMPTSELKHLLRLTALDEHNLTRHRALKTELRIRRLLKYEKVKYASIKQIVARY